MTAQEQGGSEQPAAQDAAPSEPSPAQDAPPTDRPSPPRPSPRLPDYNLEMEFRGAEPIDDHFFGHDEIRMKIVEVERESDE
jgi:hypothetical protein